LARRGEGLPWCPVTSCGSSGAANGRADEEYQVRPRDQVRANPLLHVEYAETGIEYGILFMFSLFCVILNMYVFMPYTGLTRQNALFIFLWLRHRNTSISIQQVGARAFFSCYVCSARGRVHDPSRRCYSEEGRGGLWSVWPHRRASLLLMLRM